MTLSGEVQGANGSSKCRVCGTLLTSRFCGSCGTDSHCAECGVVLTSQFCGSCGAAADSPDSVATSSSNERSKRAFFVIGAALALILLTLGGIAIAVGGSGGDETPAMAADTQVDASSTTIENTSSTSAVSPPTTTASPRPIYDSITGREFGDETAVAKLRAILPTGGDTSVCDWDCGVLASRQSWAVDEWLTYCGVGPTPGAGIRGRALKFDNYSISGTTDTAVPYLFAFSTLDAPIAFASSIASNRQCLEGLALEQTKRDAAFTGLVNPSTISISSNYFPTVVGFPFSTSRISFTVTGQLLTGQQISIVDAIDFAVANYVVAVVDQATMSADLNRSFGANVMRRMQGG